MPNTRGYHAMSDSRPVMCMSYKKPVKETDASEERVCHRALSDLARRSSTIPTRSVQVLIIIYDRYGDKIDASFKFRKSSNALL